MASVISTGGVIGAINPDARQHPTIWREGRALDRMDEVMDFALNTPGIGTDGYAYRFVQADGAIAADTTDCSVDADGQLTDDSLGHYTVSSVAFAGNEYGWVQSPVYLLDGVAS